METCLKMWKERHFKDDGIYKLWQALLYLHPGCPAVSPLSPPPTPNSKNPVSVLQESGSLFFPVGAALTVFTHVLNS